MRIPFTEPVSPRYIHVSEKNLVHLLVPVVCGWEISTDNTCKSTVALRDFFDGGVLKELNAYKNALAFDIALLEAGNPQREGKEERFAQMEAYIVAVGAMQKSYVDAVSALLSRPSNLYSIQLRPFSPDSQSKVVNPVFNVERGVDTGGVPLSAFYNAMHNIYPGVVIAGHDPRIMLTTTVLNALPASPTFADIQRVLKEQSLVLFDLPVDFTIRSDGTPATKMVIDALMKFGLGATPAEYVDALLGACAPEMWGSIPTPPFYSIPAATPAVTRIERLSILTQFFLANLAVHCKSRDISSQNFGVILDASPSLSLGLAGVVFAALSAGDDVEEKICDFFNGKVELFGLSRFLSAEDITAIKRKFERTYRTVTATTENPHMDDFKILDTEARGVGAPFVMYQGAISVHFAHLIGAVAASTIPPYFAGILVDFAQHPLEIPVNNEWVRGDVDIETLLARLCDDQCEQLPQALKEACRAHPTFQLRSFLHDVAKGRQEEAKTLIIASSSAQDLLLTPGIFTDYSGRTFNCTAYEYAYWAKDIRMCRMLEGNMDSETKAFLLERIESIDRVGLSYIQHEQEITGSKCFSLEPLKKAYNDFIRSHNALRIQRFYGGGPAVNNAWIRVGVAQRELPTHYVREYLSKGQSFDPTSTFDEPSLPEEIMLYDLQNSCRHKTLFPLVLTASSGLGIDFSFGRGWGGLQTGVVYRYVGSARLLLGVAKHDLAAVSRLDEARAKDLMQSHRTLAAVGPAHGMSS